MLYIFYGNNTVEVRTKAREHIGLLRQVCAECIEINGETYEDGVIADAIASTSLFGGEKLIILDMLSENPQAFERLWDVLDVLQGASHHFVIIEGALTAPQKKKCSMVADHAHEYTAEKEKTFNTFALTDAFIVRDKKKLWLLLNEARAHDVSPEELVGLLFWQIKTIIIVLHAKTPESAGLKPFVYQKAKQAMRHFSEEELLGFSRTLVHMYHDAHLGKVDMHQELEKWVLGL